MIGKSLTNEDIAELHTLLLAAFLNADTLARHAQDEEAAQVYRDLQNQIRKWLKRLEPAKRWGML